MKKFLSTTLLLACTAVWALAQSVTVSGTVVDENGNSLPGINVLVKGTNQGTITDIDGNYRINAPADSTLVYSFVGYQKTEEAINSRSVVDVAMEPDTRTLESVVVTALGVERSERSLTYAQQSIDTEELQRNRPTNFLQGLSGKVAGLQIANAPTNTGSNRVTIRGNSSLLGNNSPLYVIDGIIIDNTPGDQQAGAWGGADSYNPVDYGDPLSNINPDDIESMEVLKGGNATALYGSRASNGVILITTKRGSRKEGWGVTINSTTNFQNVIQYPDYQYVYGSGTAGTVANQVQDIDPETGLPFLDVSNAYGSPLLGQFEVLGINDEPDPYVPALGNVRDFYQTGVSLANAVSLSKAHERGSFRFGYTNTTGEWVIDDQDQINRHNLTIRAVQQLSDRLTADVMTMYVRDEVENRVVENGSVQNPAQNYIHLIPNIGARNLLPYRNEAGNELSFEGGNNLLRNPYWNIYENENVDLTDRIIGKWQLSYELIDNLSLTARVGTDVRSTSGYKYDAPRGPEARGDQDGRYSTFDRKISNWNLEALASYNKTFGNEITLDATLGVRRLANTFSQRQVTNELLIAPGSISLQNNAGTSDAIEDDSETVTDAAYVYANVGFRNLVFLNGTFTQEWNSVLSAGNYTYNYPSVGASFVFTELLPANDFLSFGKLRASYALTGLGVGYAQTFPNYQYINNYRGSYPFLRTNPTLNNPNLQNEETEDWEVGVETKLWQGRVNANITYYERSSSNQIISIPVAKPSGYDFAIVNGGLLTNKGWEVFVNAEVIRTKLLNRPFGWTVDVNWSRNRNRVEHLELANDPTKSAGRFILNNWAGESFVVALLPGELYGSIVGRTQAQDEEGRPLVDAASGQPVLLDNQILGNASPDWLGGVRNTIRWGGFSLNFLVDVKQGGDLLSMSHGRAAQFGINNLTLGGRDDFILSSRVLGESNVERRGEGLDGTDYNRGDRAQGAIYDGVLYTNYDPTGGEAGVFVTSGEANDIYLDPQQVYGQAWQHGFRNLFDASFVKLRELSISYGLPDSWLDRTFLSTASLSLVGRNLWIIHQNTPRGIDPEANSTSGNGQGLEYGSFLPNRTIGFNINLGF